MQASSHHRAAALVVAVVAVLGLGRARGGRGSEARRDVAVVAARDAGPLRVDPNRASVAELEALPGIGPALARRIVAARRGGQRFERLEDLGRVPGLGRGKLARLAPYVCFEAGADGVTGPR